LIGINKFKNNPAEQPLEIYKPRIQVDQFIVKYGLNLCFKKYHKFSTNPDQGGGPFGERQNVPTVTIWSKTVEKIKLVSYVCESLNDVVYCRYGLDYLKSFPRNDDMAIGSFKINVDNLIF